MSLNAFQILQHSQESICQVSIFGLQFKLFFPQTMRNLKHAYDFLEQGQNKVFPDRLIHRWSSYSIKDESIRKNYMNVGLDSSWIDRICIREMKSSLGRGVEILVPKKRCPRNLLDFLGCFPAEYLKVFHHLWTKDMSTL